MFSQFFLKRSANFLFFSVSFKIINRHALFLKGKGRPADGIVLHIGNQHPAPRRNQRFQNYIERCGGVIKKADPCGIVQAKVCTKLFTHCKQALGSLQSQPMSSSARIPQVERLLQYPVYLPWTVQ